MDEQLLMGQKSKETRWYIWTMIAIIRDSQFSISTLIVEKWRIFGTTGVVHPVHGFLFGYTHRGSAATLVSCIFSLSELPCSKIAALKDSRTKDMW